MKNEPVRIESMRTQVSEVFMEGGGINVSVYTWGNLEGCSFIVHGDGGQMPLRLAGSFRWEELDLFLAALTVARSV